jgi:hypothetical protein
VRPIRHLHAGDQDVFAVLGPEHRRLAFLHVKPILAERVADVRLVRDQKVLMPGFGGVASIFRSASARRPSSSGDTMTVVFSTSVKPASVAVS